MKQILITILLMSLLISCKDSNTVVLSKEEFNELKRLPKPEYPKELSDISFGDGSFDYLNKVQIIVVDNCEYIVGYSRYYDGGPIFTHRAKCKYCKEERKLENNN